MRRHLSFCQLRKCRTHCTKRLCGAIVALLTFFTAREPARWCPRLPCRDCDRISLLGYGPPDILAAAKIGYRAGHLQYTVICAGAHIELFHGALQQPPGCFVEAAISALSGAVSSGHCSARGLRPHSVRPGYFWQRLPSGGCRHCSLPPACC